MELCKKSVTPVCQQWSHTNLFVIEKNLSVPIQHGLYNTIFFKISVKDTPIACLIRWGMGWHPIPHLIRQAMECLLQVFSRDIFCKFNLGSHFILCKYHATASYYFCYSSTRMNRTNTLELQSYYRNIFGSFSPSGVETGIFQRELLMPWILASPGHQQQCY